MSLLLIFAHETFAFSNDLEVDGTPFGVVLPVKTKPIDSTFVLDD